ncbi:MAG: hypothetical protein JSR45_11630 [Proteobacteria bacterium]|nr:hypothetical protein [Pseudomonadota bacterium]
MNRPILAAAGLYFALVFAAGFALGTVRVLYAAPRWGELAAVMVEAPLMLLASWLACGVAVRRFAIRGRLAGLAMGVTAFVLLMTAELALAVLAFGRPPAEFVGAWAAPAGALGLASQIVFALLPAIRTPARRLR